MNHTGTEHDNEILVDFNILFDTDLAIYKIIKSKYRNIPYTDKRLMKIDNEYQAIFLLLMREKNNPLSILMPEVNSDKLYQQFLNDKETLFKYTKQTDLFRFMHILSINASSISITSRLAVTLRRDAQTVLASMPMSSSRSASVMRSSM